MNLLNRSLSASIFSLGKDGYSAEDAPLPSDALVIVIQDRSDKMAPLPLLGLPNCRRFEQKSFPVLRRKVGTAYCELRPPRVSGINLSG